MITLRFSDLGWPVISPIISFWTRSWVNHVDAVLLDGSTITAVPGGVQRRAPSPARRAETVEIPCSLEQRRAFWTWMHGEIGKPYDYLGVIGFPAGIHDDRRWFCSELVAAGLRNAEIVDFGADHTVSPARLYRTAKRITSP